MARLWINVRGKQHCWSFPIEGDISELREDGLDVVEVHHSIPKWAVDAGLLRVWTRGTDVLRAVRRFVWR